LIAALQRGIHIPLAIIMQMMVDTSRVNFSDFEAAVPFEKRLIQHPVLVHTPF
jgi:hypothetical protein